MEVNTTDMDKEWEQRGGIGQENVAKGSQKSCVKLLIGEKQRGIKSKSKYNRRE